MSWCTNLTTSQLSENIRLHTFSSPVTQSWKHWNDTGKESSWSFIMLVLNWKGWNRRVKLLQKIWETFGKYYIFTNAKKYAQFMAIRIEWCYSVLSFHNYLNWQSKSTKSWKPYDCKMPSADLFLLDL